MKYLDKQIYFDNKGYALIWLNGRDHKVHVLVWESINGPKPEGMVIHHKDENKENFKLENLELLSHSEHQRIHSGWIRVSGEWTHKPCNGCGDVLSLEMFYPRKGYTPSSQCKKCHCKLTKKWALNNPKKRKEIALKYYYQNKLAGGKTYAGE